MMHKLTRPTETPSCLSRYRHGANQWSEVTPDEKAEIWKELNKMQQGRCAYCECPLPAKNCERALPVKNDRCAAHIEHFRPRKPYKARKAYKEGTFDWTNLFGSCNRQDSCGKHKDGCDAYNHADLIKPDIEDPEHFFLFVSDGSIAIRQGLSPAERHRAAETLRILNLDAQRGALRQIRFNAVQGYVQTAEELAAWIELLPEDEWSALLRQELDAVGHLPFVTAIKHILSGA